MTIAQTLQALEAQLAEDEAAAASLESAADACGAGKNALGVRLRDAASRIRRLVKTCRARATASSPADFTRGQFVTRKPE